MDNKYQESLDAIKDLINALPICEYAIGKESIGDLQELIDKYAELEKAFELACEYLEDGYGTDYVGRHPVFVGSRLDWQRYLMNLAWKKKRK